MSTMTNYTQDERVADRLRLQSLEAEISTNRDAPATSHTERKLLQDRLYAYVYPVLTLPHEITSEIFLRYIPTYPARPVLFGDESPSRLSHICAQWRQAALATPALWRAIALPTPWSDIEREFYISIAASWLERSGTLPLSISVDASPDLDLLVPFAARWEYVSLERYLPLARFPQNLPALVELKINLDREEDEVVTVMDAPKLATLSIFAVGIQPLQHFPWAQLSSLHLREARIPVVVAVLPQCRALRHCRLGLKAGLAASLNIDPIKLDTLNSLVIEFWTNQEPLGPRALVHALRVPALKNFLVHGDLFHQDHPASFASLISTMGCTLERLCIARPESPRAEYTATFPGVPHLELRDDSEVTQEDWGY
ncbi:F-box domain-containing protein [Mycena kentingensis (nom. inval.)]|nr:F-box domain-containing protein [Mycena kentingensis (nom. inval.)]